MLALDMILDRFERWTIFASFTVCLLVLTLGVMTRYVFMRPLSWPDELSTYLFILMSFLGASASVRSGSELRVDALYEQFPGLRLGLDIWLHLVRLLAALFFIVTGCKFVALEWEFMNVSPILHIPIPLVFCMLPMLGTMLALRSLIRLALLFRER